MNPLLDFSSLPRFGEIRPEHVTPAIEQLIAQCKTTIAELEAPATPATWDGFVVPLEDATERLGRAWGIVGHLNAVADTPALRAAYNENLPQVTEFWTALAQNLALYSKYKAVQAAPEFAGLSSARRKTIENALRDFRLGGAELPENDKPRFAQIQEEQAAASQRFSENVLDATNDWSLHLDDDTRLAGVPDDVKQAAAEKAAKDSKRGYVFTLHFPSYFPLLQYADDRALRETVYHANATKAAEFGKPQWDNTALITQLLRLRAEEARLLGYRNFAEVSLVPKMAQTPAEVIAFLDDVAARAKPYAERDMRELRAFARDHLGIEKLEPWDVAYASEKLREQRYAFSDQEVKQYFPEPKVLEGLFRVIQTLFGVNVRPDTAPVWHPDVRFFRIENPQGELVAQFYVDLYARPGKRSGAWMDDARARRRRTDGSTQTPAAYLTCNFSAPVGDKPALFTHDEVLTLFHEFGHGLHHMLTRIDDLAVSGISGVEWDAVELPSQFMENFGWQREALDLFARHWKTGEKLPDELFARMQAARHFHAGMFLVRQLEFGLFDFRIHREFDPARGARAMDILREVRDEVAVVHPPEWQRFPHAFTHVFAGGYGAGYYSYLWAEVLSADAFGRFEEAGVFDRATGEAYRKAILAVGGSRPALESFVEFRGREPLPDALLRSYGLVA